MLLVHDQDVPERPCRGRARGRSPPSRWRRCRGVVLPRGADLPCDAWLQPAQAGGRVGTAEEEAGGRRSQAASDNEEEEEERRCTEEARRQAGEAAAAARECTPHVPRRLVRLVYFGSDPEYLRTPLYRNARPNARRTLQNFPRNDLFPLSAVSSTLSVLPSVERTLSLVGADEAAGT